jgi:hypothetical protein
LCVSVEEPFPGHVLQIALEGVEETYFGYDVTTGHGKRRHTRTIKTNGLNKFLNFSVPVHDFAQGTAGGFEL